MKTHGWINIILQLQSCFPIGPERYPVVFHSEHSDFPDVWIRMCNAVWGVWELIMVVFYPRVETQCCLLFCGREDCQNTLYVSAYGIVSSWFNFVGRLLRPRGNSLKRVEASTGYCVYIRAKCPIRDIDKELRIISCNNLKSLPSVQAMQRLTNLQTLYISGCHPHLKERCTEGSGTDLPKISHIPNIITVEVVY